MRIGLIGVGRIGVFHASTLRGLPGVDSLINTDADTGRARQVAGEYGAQAAESVTEFCEKPVAPNVEGTLDVIKSTSGGAVPVQIGFQRRFDAGFREVREAARSGSLGWLHTIRSTTFDAAPPPAGYIAGSGGIFRDCAVHDFDAIRWVTGREVVQVYAMGANRGAEFFRAAGDVDTACAALTLDDGTLATVSCGRYNDAGYDVRLEVLGSAGSVCAGLDDRMPLRSAEPGQRFPAGPPYRHFLGRFGDAYVAELAAFVDVAAGRTASPCTPQDALEASYVAEACELSRYRRQPVLVTEVRQ